MFSKLVGLWFFPKANGFACSRHRLGVKWYDGISLKENEKFLVCPKHYTELRGPKLFPNVAVSLSKQTFTYLQTFPHLHPTP